MPFAAAPLKQRILSRCIEQDGPLDTPCLVWTGVTNRDGYGYLTVSGNKTRKVHRLIWSIENGEPEPRMEVCHHCDRPPCCRIEHLYLGTHARNMGDASLRQRFPDRRCDKHPQARLTNEQVSRIKYFLNQGWSVTELAKRYAVDREALYHVKHQRTWRHVEAFTPKEGEPLPVPPSIPEPELIDLEKIVSDISQGLETKTKEIIDWDKVLADISIAA